MAENNKTFILVGKFDDQITPALKKINRTINAFDRKLNKGISATFREMNKEARDFAKEIGRLEKVFEGRSMRGVQRISTSLSDAARAAGKVRDTVSQIGEGVRGFDHMAESMGGVARAASRAQTEVLGIGEAASKANRQAEDLMTTLLKAEGLSKFGDAMAQGFNRGVGMIAGTAKKSAGFVAAQYRKAMEDEMADIKATTSVQGSFTRAGFKGTAQGGGLSFEEAGKFYKKFDMQIAEMIRTSAAPTGKVVELQRFTMDTLGPLLLAAEGVKKGTKVADIKPDTVNKVSKTYGGMLEQIALLSQGTGSATFRVAQGVEGLIKYGKIDTTMDFFTDNVLLMQALQDAGFAGGRGGGGLKQTSLKTEAERLVALQKALEAAQSREGIKKMSESLTGSIQGLMDTLTNPSVGVFGMATTFSEKEQKNVDKTIKEVYDKRIKDLNTELAILNKSGKDNKKTLKRRQQLEKDIQREKDEVAYLTKEGASQITSPFKAFNLMFGKMIRSLTEALNAIGPIWNRFAVTVIQWTDKFLRPLDIALKNVASDMRADIGNKKQAFNIGRIVGEFYKFIGEALGDLGRAITDPKSVVGKAQSQFMQGFMAAFKSPGSYEKAKQGIIDGIGAIVKKILEVIASIITSDEMRPIVMPLVLAAFGPSVLSATIAAITPLMISQSLAFFGALWAKAKLLSLGPKVPVPTPRTFTPSQRLLGMGGGMLPGAAATAGAGAAGAGGAAAGGAGGGAATAGGGAAAGGGAGLAAAGAALIAGAILFEKPLLSLANWLKSTGEKMKNMENIAANGFAVLLKGLGTLTQGLVNTINGAFQLIVNLFTGDTEKVKQGFVRMMTGVTQVLGGLVVSVIGIVTTLGGAIVKAIQTLLQTVLNAVLGIKPTTPRAPGKYENLTDLQFSNYIQALKNWKEGGKKGPKPEPPQGYRAQAFGSPGTSFGSLGEAVNYEMKNKPPGSDLVVANSSETIIPAAEGLGSMKGVIDAIWQSARSTANSISTGFSVLANTVKTTQERSMQVTRLSAAQTTAAINRSMQVSMAGDRQILTAIKAAAAAKGFPGLGGQALGTASGSLGAAAQLASSMGLMTTSGYRPGDPGYHGANRARDFSNSTGPTPQMMAFAQRMASTFGSSITELIYTPLGYSIKNGRKVPPIAAGSHYNHVHVAFGRGPGQPTLFSSANAAAAYERMMAPAGARVASVTANSSEFGGGNTYNVNPTISISGYNQDPETLARIVWQHTFEEIQRMRSMRTT